MTYNCQDEGYCRQREHLVFEELRVQHAVILFSSEPCFVDQRLDNGCKENPRFLLCVLIGWCQRLGCKRLMRETCLVNVTSLIK